MKYIRILAVGLVLSGSPGCAGVQRVVDALPTVIQYVQDAEMILDAIDRAVLPILSIRNDPDLLQNYSVTMGTARKSLQVALRSAEGGQQLSKEEVSAAFASFRDAYAQLLEVLQQANLMNGSGTMAVAPGLVNVTVETPLAVSRTGG